MPLTYTRTAYGGHIALCCEPPCLPQQAKTHHLPRGSQAHKRRKIPPKIPARAFPHPQKPRHQGCLRCGYASQASHTGTPTPVSCVRNAQSAPKAKKIKEY